MEFSILRATVGERLEIQAYHIPHHMNGTSYSPESYAAQLADLPTDFPHLYSDEAFERSHVFVIRKPTTNELIGMVALEPHVGDDKTIDLKAISVAEAHRREGLGQKLLSHAIETARGLGYAAIKLVTLDVLPIARRLYERNGFRVVEEKPIPFYILYTYQLDL